MFDYQCTPSHWNGPYLKHLAQLSSNSWKCQIKIQEMVQDLPKFEWVVGYILGRHHLMDFHSPETSGVIVRVRLNDWLKPRYFNFTYCQYVWSSQIINESVSSFTPSISSAISYSTFDVGMDYLGCDMYLQFYSRQNKERCSQTPGGHQNMIIKYLSVGP